MKHGGLVAFVTALALTLAHVVPDSPRWCDAAGPALSRGQRIYVPAYSFIPIGEKGQPFELAATLCLRNTDATRSVTVVSADYHDSQGRLIRRFIGKPQGLGPLASIHFFMKASDMTGGLAPSFLIKWKASEPVSELLAEAVLVGDRSGLGVSLVFPGKVIEELTE